MEHHCFCINYFLFFIIFILTTKSVFGYRPQNVLCFFKSEPGDCTDNCHSGFTVPAGILEAYNNLQPHIRSAFENGNCDLSDTDFQRIPPVLFNLMPVHKLSHCNGSALATVVNKYLYETSLTVHIMEALNTEEKRSNFLKQLSRQGLSEGVLAVIAQSISSWKNNFELDMFDLSPSLVISFPPEYLWSLSDNGVRKFLYIASENESGVRVNQLTRRILAFFALKNPSLPATLKEWTLTGFTADELGSTLITKDKFQLDFDLLQARAVFKNLHSNKNTVMLNVNDYLPLIPKLTPELLQTFNIKNAHFEQITKLPNRESRAAAIQIAEFITAKMIDDGELKENSKWTEKIKYLKKWAYTLSPTTLNQDKPEKIPLSEMQKLESPMLTDLQIYYLTNEGKILNLSTVSTILSMQTLLSSLPTSQLLLHKTGSIQSRVLQHLLRHLPGNNVPRTISLLQKIWTELGNSKLFRSLLLNKDINNILSFIPSWVIRENADSISHVLIPTENKTDKTIQNLPAPFLAVLLRKERGEVHWKLEAESNSYHYLNKLILGLTCDDINMLETSHFIIVMDHYNQIRISRNKVFPKNLQYCCFRKLIEYLQLKSNLTKSSKSLINQLEPMEIHAVGGYVLAGLPFKTIQVSAFSDYILMSISKLSVGELLTAVGGNLEKLKELANGADTKLKEKQIAQNGTTNFYFLGNLQWFTALENIENHTAEIRVTIESKELDHRFCGSEDHRTGWSQYLISLFGSPDSWSSSVLSSLADLLIVFSEEQLQNVKKASWIEAADTMPSHLDEVIEWIEPQPFYQVCMSVLGESEGKKYLIALKRLIRWKLKAAQWQQDTVHTTFNIHNQNIIAKPVSFDQNPLKPQSQIIVEKLNLVMPESSEHTLCKNCARDDDDPKTTSTLTYGNDTNLNNDYVSSTPEVVSSSTVHTSLAIHNTFNSIESTGNSASEEYIDFHTEPMYKHNNTEEINVHSSVKSESITEETNYMLPTSSEATPLEQKFSHANNASDVRESLQDVNDYDEDAVTGSFTVLDTNIANERLKRDMGRTYNKISCNTLIVVGSLAGVALSEEDIHNMPDTELFDCAEIFGNMNLEKKLQFAIWKRIHELQNGTIPIHMLGNLVQAMMADDVKHIKYNFSVPWALEAVHTLSQNTVNESMVEYLVKQIKHENTVEHIGSSLSSLGSLICNFVDNKHAEILEQIEYAVVSLGKSKTCFQCLSNLTESVITYGGAGNVKSWNSDDVSSLGTIVAGVNQEQWLLLVESEHRPLSGLQPYAARCLSTDQLKVLNQSVLSIIPPLTLEAIAEHHSQHLSATQRVVIEHVRSFVITTDLLAVKNTDLLAVNNTDLLAMNSTDLLETNPRNDCESPKGIQTNFIGVLTIYFLFFFIW